MTYYFILENGQPMDREFYHSDDALNRAVEYADADARIVCIGESDGKPTIRDMGSAETWRAILEDERQGWADGEAAERSVFYSHASRGTRA